MLTARFCRLSVHYSVACLMSSPNIHFGNLKDGGSAIEIFEAEVISEMQISRFILVLGSCRKKAHLSSPSSVLYKICQSWGNGKWGNV